MNQRHVSLLIAIGLLLGGCGSSSHSSSTTSTAQSTRAAPTATTTTKQKRPSAHGQTVVPGRSHYSGSPPAPAGLRTTSGYSTYELCTSNCAGGISASIRRPLRTPASCTPHAGAGPVTPQPSTSLHVTSFIGSAWDGGRVNWLASSSYRGPILIRGRQVGGSGAVGFGEGHVPYDELQLQTGSAGPPWQSFTRVQSPGCYFYQVDGTSFSETIVFKAI